MKQSKGKPTPVHCHFQSDQPTLRITLPESSFRLIPELENTAAAAQPLPEYFLAGRCVLGGWAVQRSAAWDVWGGIDRAVLGRLSW